MPFFIGSSTSPGTADAPIRGLSPLELAPPDLWPQCLSFLPASFAHSFASAPLSRTFREHVGGDAKLWGMLCDAQPWRSGTQRTRCVADAIDAESGRSPVRLSALLLSSSASPPSPTASPLRPSPRRTPRAHSPALPSSPPATAQELRALHAALVRMRILQYAAVTSSHSALGGVGGLLRRGGSNRRGGAASGGAPPHPLFSRRHGGGGRARLVRRQARRSQPVALFRLAS